MRLTLLKSKIDKGRITETKPKQEGSCAISADLMELAGILDYEQIHVHNLSSGKRFLTYAMSAEPGEGIIAVHGADSSKVKAGDKVSISAFGQFDHKAAATFKPTLVYLSSDNSVSHTANALGDD